MGALSCGDVIVAVVVAGAVSSGMIAEAGVSSDERLVSLRLFGLVIGKAVVIVPAPRGDAKRLGSSRVDVRGAFKFPSCASFFLVEPFGLPLPRRSCFKAPSFQGATNPRGASPPCLRQVIVEARFNLKR